MYLGWVRRWRLHWRLRDIDETRHLTLVGVVQFASKQIGPRHRRRISPACREHARSSLHAWSWALQTLREVVPCWRPMPLSVRLPALLQSYVEHRRSLRGVVDRTLRLDVDVASEFLATLKSRDRTIASTRIVDIDVFVDSMLVRWSRSTVAGRCSSLRSLRFLRVTGRLRQDFAISVVGSRVSVAARPPRALP